MSMEQHIRALGTHWSSAGFCLFSSSGSFSPLGPQACRGQSSEGGQAHLIAFLSLCFLDFEQCYYTTSRFEKQFCPQGHLPPRPRASVAPLQSHPPLITTIPRSFFSPEQPWPLAKILLRLTVGRSGWGACLVSLHPRPALSAGNSRARFSIAQD